MRRTILFLATLATPATAQDLLFFQAPSGNIHCMIATGDWPEARCDILEATRSYTIPPADCDLDWGTAFAVGPDGEGAPICAGDTVAMGDSPVLGYGETVTFGDFTCSSDQSGMTCTNGMGHGFSLARAGQEVF